MSPAARTASETIVDLIWQTPIQPNVAGSDHVESELRDDLQRNYRAIIERCIATHNEQVKARGDFFNYFPRERSKQPDLRLPVCEEEIGPASVNVNRLTPTIVRATFSSIGIYSDTWLRRFVYENTVFYEDGGERAEENFDLFPLTTYDEFAQLYQQDPTIKMRLTFGTPTCIRGISRYRKLHKATVGFHEAGGKISFRVKNRSYLIGDFLRTILRYEVIAKRPDPPIGEQWQRLARKILRHLHPNAWVDLRQRLETDPENAVKPFVRRNNDVRLMRVSHYLPDWHKAAAQQAFDNKTNFRYAREARGARGRDIKFELTVGEDGGLRSFFSSEFPSCANGQYYYLLNPDVALHAEDD